jgi:hypothetical protein
MLSTLEAKKKTSKLLARPFEKPETAGLYPDATSRATFTRAEAATLAAHRDKATAAMRAGRTAREHAKRNGPVSQPLGRPRRDKRRRRGRGACGWAGGVAKGMGRAGRGGRWRWRAGRGVTLREPCTHAALACAQNRTHVPASSHVRPSCAHVHARWRRTT